MSRAAGWVALALGALALAPEPSAPPCRAPAEIAAAGAHTREVGCDGEGGPLRGPARLLFGERIDPNRADAATLETLPGVGPGRAAALLEARARRRFCDPADLETVKGIGPKTRRQIEPWLAFEPAPDCERGSKSPMGREN